MPSAYSKGDRVEFDYKNRTLIGTVSRGGTKPKVVADGGKMAFNVPSELLRVSDVALPRDEPHPMDAWGLKGYAEVAALSEETIAFTATVTENGTAVLSAKNDGKGGCNSYYSMSGGYSTVTRFEEAAKQWLVDHGMPPESCFEAGDMWLTWKATEAPYGVTAKDMVANHMENMGSFGEQEEAASPAP